MDAQISNGGICATSDTFTSSALMELSSDPDFKVVVFLLFIFFICGETLAAGHLVFYNVVDKLTQHSQGSLTQMWAYTVTCRLLLQIILIRYKGLINTIFQNNQHPVHFIWNTSMVVTAQTSDQHNSRLSPMCHKNYHDSEYRYF